MATIYQRANSPYWYGEYRLNGKRVRFATDCTDRRRAQREADQAEAEAKARVVAGRGIHFGDAAAVFFATKKLAPATVRQYERSMGHILETSGDFPMAALGKSGVNKHIKARRGVCGDVTLRRELAFLSSLYEFTMPGNEDIEANPVKLVDKKSIADAEKRKRYTSSQEYQKLLDNCTDRLHRTIVILGVNTGMRAQEMLQLHIDEVDFKRMEIVLPEWRTKSDDPRYIPLTPAAYEALQLLAADWRSFYATQPWTHKGSHKKRPRLSSWSGYFFENHITGKPLTSVKSWWKNLKAKSGVRDLKLHDLRHTFATWGLQAGGDQISLMAITGHRSVASFARYSHATEEGRRRAVSLLSGHTSVTQADDNSVTHRKGV